MVKLCSARAKSSRTGEGDCGTLPMKRRHAQDRGDGPRHAAVSPAKQKELKIMQKNSNRLNIPEARDAMDQFKMQAASDLRVSGDY